MGDVAKHIDVVINGVSGTAMQAFGPQLNDADLAALVTYERNACGNDTGDVVQPADIKAAR
jgi:cytochrome c oxidase subunit 2